MIRAAKNVVELTVTPKMEQRISQYIYYLFTQKEGVYKNWLITKYSVRNIPEYDCFKIVIKSIRNIKHVCDGR